MPSPTQGQVLTNTTNQTTQIRTATLNKLIMTRPKDHPLFTLLYGSAVNKKLSPIPHKPTSTQFRVFEMDPMPDEATVSGGHTAATLSITVDDASPYVGRDNIQVVANAGGSVGEIMRVSSVNTTTNVITVQARGMHNSTAAAINDGATVKKIGSAIGEGGVDTKGVLIPRPSTYTGCIQYFGEEIGATAHRLSEEIWYGDEWVVWEWDMVDRWKKSIELAFLCNNLADTSTTSSVGTASTNDYGNIIFTTDGVHGRVSTNRFSIPGAGYRDFTKKIGQALKVNESAPDIQWVGLVPWDTMDYIGSWGDNFVRYRESEDVFGFTPSYLRVAGVNRSNQLPLFYCPIMDQTMFDRGMILLSIGQSSGVPHIQMRYMQERQGPRKMSWDFAMKTEGTDINPKEMTARVLRRIECIVGLQLNVEKKHVVFDELAPA